MEGLPTDLVADFLETTFCDQSFECVFACECFSVHRIYPVITIICLFHFVCISIAYEIKEMNVNVV